jgi:hypothetical protein
VEATSRATKLLAEAALACLVAAGVAFVVLR